MPDVDITLTVDPAAFRLDIPVHAFVDEVARRLRQDIVAAQSTERRSQAMTVGDCGLACSTVANYIRELVLQRGRR